MRPFLKASALRYSIRKAHIVDDATISLLPGRLAIIVGPNGAGKSTLLKLLSGELRPTSGEISCCSEPLHLTPAWRLARRRAVMAQATQLAFSFTVEEVVRIGLDTVGVAKKGEELDAIVLRAIRRADILHLVHRKYDTLSGGEQQRTHFARVVSQLEAGRASEGRQALFLDEPVASLDIRYQLALLDAAREIARTGVAVLAILHDLNLAAAYADELIVMQSGKIVAAGDPANVMAGGLIADVFGVDLRLCAAPPRNAVFILPHGHARRVAWRQPNHPEPFQTLIREDSASPQRSELCAIFPRNERVSMPFSLWS